MIFGRASTVWCAVAARVVQQDDAAFVALFLDALDDHIGAGSRPILRIDVLHDDEVTEFILRNA